MRGQLLFGLVVIAAAGAGYACGGSPTSPTFPVNPNTGPPPPPAPFVTGLKVTGATTLSALGETSQLTAIATVSDGTTRDVTSEAQWQSMDPAVVAVSSHGVLTAVAFGTTEIRALYEAKFAQFAVVATPPGTFVAFGRVREPGKGGVNGVRVSDPQSGRSTVTATTSGEDGRYSIGGLTNTRLAFAKDGYESREADIVPNTYTAVALQHIVRLSAGETVTPSDLAPNDMSYVVGADRCEPCRLIRVVVSGTGTLRLRLTWKEERATLNLWGPDGRYTGAYPELTSEMPVTSGEVILYVGVLRGSGTGQSVYVPFALATSFTP